MSIRATYRICTDLEGSMFRTPESGVRSQPSMIRSDPERNPSRTLRFSVRAD